MKNMSLDMPNMISKMTGVSVLALGLALSTGTVQAQSVGMGTAQQGAYTYSAGAAIAKVASDNGLSMRIQPFAGTSAYVPVLDKGELQFALANQLETLYAVRGEAIYKGRPHPNLRVVAIMVPFGGSFYVKKDSPIKTMADLKGKRVPAKFTSARVLEVLVNASLANVGLTYNDVQPFPVTSVPSNADAYARGQTDAFFFAAGAGKVREVDAKVGGLRALPFNDDPKSVAAMRKIVPVAYITTMKPRPGLAGFDTPTKIMAYDYLVLSNAKTSDEQVYQLTKIMHGNKKAMAENFRPLAGFEPDRMNKDMGELKFHPGAIKFYTEMKAWPPKKGD